MKGTMQTLEAAISIIMILSVAVFLFSPSLREEGSLRDVGYNCLRHLDEKGVLREYAIIGGPLLEEIGNCLPGSVDFKVKVCSTADCSETLPEKQISSATYLISGYDSYNPKIINLWMWSKI